MKGIWIYLPEKHLSNVVRQLKTKQVKVFCFFLLMTNNINYITMRQTVKKLIIAYNEINLIIN